jgi:hypothetical protein
MDSDQRKENFELSLEKLRDVLTRSNATEDLAIFDNPKVGTVPILALLEFFHDLGYTAGYNDCDLDNTPKYLV